MAGLVRFCLYPRENIFSIYPIVDVIGILEIESSKEKWKETLVLEAFRVIDISYYFRASLCKETILPQKLEPGYRYVCFSLRFPTVRGMYKFLECM